MRKLLFAIGILGCLVLASFRALPIFADEPVSRREALTVVLNSRPETRGKVEQFRVRRSKLPLFVDVDQRDDFAPFAEAAFSTGLTSGFPDRTLRPEDDVAVEEAVMMVLKTFGREGERMEGDTEYIPYLRQGLYANVVPRPRSKSIGQPISRMDFLTMVERMTVVERENLVAYESSEPEEEVLVTVESNPEPGPGPGPETEWRAADVGQAVPVGADAAIPDGGPVYVAQSSSDQGTIMQYASSQGFAITIPALKIRDLSVIHPQDAHSDEGVLAPLKHGVGHLFSYPGKGGKIMVYGHSSGYAWDVSTYTKIFRQINRLKSGDRIYVTFNGNLYEYAVTGQQTIAPTDKGPFTGEGEELILYTCWPPDSIKQRLIVRAVPTQMVAVR